MSDSPGKDKSIYSLPPEERLALLVDAVIDYAIYLIDLQGNVASWNAGAQRIKGYLPEEVIGQHFSTFFTEEDRQADLPARALATAAKEGRFETEAWRVRKDGSRLWAVVVIDAVRDSEGSLIGFAKVTRDITAPLKRDSDIPSNSSPNRRKWRQWASSPAGLPMTSTIC